jgi:hypothetical protein
MKQEYKDKIDRVKQWAETNVDDLPEEDTRKLALMHYALVEDLARTKDSELLPVLFSFFNDKTDCYEGFSEMLSTEISYNYTLEQILKALSEEFDSFCETSPDWCATVSNWLFNEGLFDTIRRLFNFYKPRRSQEFLQELSILSEDDEPGYNHCNAIAILREDMKHWPGERAQAQIPTLKG